MSRGVVTQVTDTRANQRIEMADTQEGSLSVIVERLLISLAHYRREVAPFEKSSGALTEMPSKSVCFWAFAPVGVGLFLNSLERISLIVCHFQSQFRFLALEEAS